MVRLVRARHAGDFRVELAAYGWPTLAWDCGFDLAPEYLYELATGKRPSWAV